MNRKSHIAALIAAILLATMPCYTASADPLDSAGNGEPVPIMKRIENFALKDNPVSKLVRSFFVTTSSTATVQPDTTKANEVKFNSYEGYIIRNVNVTTLGPFGYSVNEPVCYSINRFQRLGNKV